MQGARVLVVDDDATIREVVGQFLQDEGYQPILARDGLEAIASLDPDGPLPDVMLLDLVMPRVSGYEVLEYLRRNLLEKFPVLVFSAQRPDVSILDALEGDLRDFVAKPFDLVELLVRMQRLLQRSPRAVSAQAQILRIYALGSLRVYRDDHLLFDESWRSKGAKTIFKLLFTHPGRRYPKDVLTEELWPEVAPDVGANRLRVAVHELRKMLGDRVRGDAAIAIAQQEGAYFFDPAVPHWSDVQAFQTHAERGRAYLQEGRLHDALQSFESASALYQGDYLRDDPYLEWTVGTRERLREMQLGMLGDAARIYARLDRPGEAAAFCRRILRYEPWREEVYRRLMEYLVAAGRPHEALRAFDECARQLSAQLDVAPDATTVALRDRIAQALAREQTDSESRRAVWER